MPGELVERKLPVVSVDWICPGWVLKLKPDAGIEVDQITAVEPVQKAKAILSAIHVASLRPEIGSSFLNRSDCALVNEFFPDALLTEA